MGVRWEQVKENAVFLLVCLAVAAALFAVARVAERYLPKKRAVSAAQRVSMIGVFAAVATVLHVLDFPLLFLAPEFYKLDFSEVPVLLCGFYLGPSSVVVCEGVKIFLKLMVKGTTTAFVGDFANFAVGCSLVLPACILYHVRKTKKTAIIGMALGTVVLTVFGSLFNAVYLLPKFAALYGIPLEQIVGMGQAVNAGVTDVTTFVLFCVAPLNLVKGIAVSLLTFLLYKRLEKLFFRK